MSTKNKKIVYYLAAFLVVLMLVCTCLLGNTFARYTSNGTGTGSVSIASWNVGSEYSQSATSFTFSTKLSPSQASYGSQSSARTNVIKSGNYMTLTNTSDVAADVTITVSDISITLKSGSSYDGTGYSVSGGTYAGGGASEDQVEAVFATYSVGVYTDNSLSTSATPNNGVYTMAATSSNLYIQPTLTWTSLYNSDSNQCNEALSDAIDTWIGINVASVILTVTWTAVQGSQLPSA